MNAPKAIELEQFRHNGKIPTRTTHAAYAMKLEDFETIVNAHPVVDILEQANNEGSDKADNCSALYVVLVTRYGRGDEQNAPKESRNQPQG
jgi:hypothetical protein